MRIVQIINSLDTGGAETLAQGLHRQYLRRGHGSVILTLSGRRYGWSGPGIYSLGLRGPYEPSAVPLMVDLPADIGLDAADVVHTSLFPTQALVPLYSGSTSFNGILVTTEHSTSNRRRGSRWWRLFDGWTYRCYRRIVCVSEAAAKELGSWVPGVRGRISVIPNGIDLDEFHPPEAGRRNSPPLILSAGRLTGAKNYRKALEAFAIQLRSGLSCRYLIAGGGPLEAELRSMASDLGVAGSVEFLGETDDIAGLMRMADLFFMPSAREGFGLAAVEAMACGLPVVASDIPGIGDIVGRDRECGILVDPDSTPGMAEALEWMLRNPSEAEKMGRSGTGRAASYSIEKCALMHLDLYEEVLTGRRGGPAC